MFNQEKTFTLAEVSERTSLSKEAARRDIKDLLAAGVLSKKGTGVALRYQANTRFEHFTALNAFIRETTSARPKEVIALLKQAGSLRLVVLSGHFMSILESQIDLLVVGDNLDERTLARVVHALEAELGREIRYASFATPDFRYRLGVYDRLLRDVFDYPHRLLLDKIGL